MVVHASLICKDCAAGAYKFELLLGTFVAYVNRLLHATIWVDKVIKAIITSTWVHTEGIAPEWIILRLVPIVIPEYKTSFGQLNDIE